MYNPAILPPGIGTTATYICDTGFSLTGDGTPRVCQEDNTFSGEEAPICQQGGCGLYVYILYILRTLINSVYAIQWNLGTAKFWQIFVVAYLAIDRLKYA